MLSLYALTRKKRSRTLPIERTIASRHEHVSLQDDLKKYILCSMLPPKIAFKQAMDSYQELIQSQPNRSGRTEYLELMKTSLKNCPASVGTPYASDEFVLAIQFTKSHSIEKLKQYPWGSRLPYNSMEIHDIEVELIDFIIDVCENFYSRIQTDADKESVLFAHTYSIMRRSELLIDFCSNILKKLENIGMSDKEYIENELMVESVLKDTEYQLEKFLDTLSNLKFPSLVDVHANAVFKIFCTHLLNIRLSLLRSDIERASLSLATCTQIKDLYTFPVPRIKEFQKLRAQVSKLASRVSETVDIEISDEEIDNVALETDEPIQKKKIKKKKKKNKKEDVELPVSIDDGSVRIVEPGEVCIEPDSQQPLDRILEIQESSPASEQHIPTASVAISPKLNPVAQPWIGQPSSYRNNPELKIMFQKLNLLFKESICEGWVYGSAITDNQPGDIDILLSGVKSAEDMSHVNRLITQMIGYGAVVTSYTELSYGYAKNNRHIIPMLWDGYKIEFSLFEKSYIEHAQKLDFTVRALYFNLKTLRLLAIDGIPALFDLEKGVIQTITPAAISLREDPIRVLRAVRLISKGLGLSDECRTVIGEMFSGDDNPFAMINRNKLSYHLSVLLEPRYVQNSIDILHRLGLFFKLFECFHRDYIEDEKFFLCKQVLFSYYSKFTAGQTVPVMTQTPSRFFSAPRAAQSTQYAYASDVDSQAALMQWYPAST